MSEVINRAALSPYLSGNKDGGAHEHAAYFSDRKVKTVCICLFFSTVIIAYKTDGNGYI